MGKHQMSSLVAAPGHPFQRAQTTPDSLVGTAECSHSANMAISLLESREVNNSSWRKKQMCISVREMEGNIANEVLICVACTCSV